jgi:hypothetical protein
VVGTPGAGAEGNRESSKSGTKNRRRKVSLRVIPTNVHGVIDYVASGALYATPALPLQLAPEVIELLPERVAGLDPPPALVDSRAHQLILEATLQRACRFVGIRLPLGSSLVAYDPNSSTFSSWCMDLARSCSRVILV